MSSRILEPLDLIDVKVYVKCIKGGKLGANKSYGVLELIYTDIYGSFLTTSKNDQHYFITFIDDYSRYMYLYLIHKKYQSLDIFKAFKTKVENQFYVKTNAIKFDRGGKCYGRYEDKVKNVKNLLRNFLRNVISSHNTQC